jgi:pyridoxal phosphate enzyme (YggS family)
MAELIAGLDADRIRANLARIREEVDAAAGQAGRAAGDVEICAAIKYVAVEDLAAVADAGVTLVGENRAQDLVAKRAALGDRFTWDFIGHLQSRKVKQVVGEVRLIQSVASDSVLAQLEKHAPAGTEVLIEVNVAGEEAKSGVAPGDLAAFIERCPVRVGGLMTMPPFAPEAETSRRHFAALRDLAGEHGLERLSMGTSQDYVVAAEEGATIVRIGTTLYA